MDTVYEPTIEKFAARIRELSDEELSLCSYVHAERVTSECSCYEAGFEYGEDPGTLAKWRERWCCPVADHWRYTVIRHERERRGLKNLEELCF